nr:MAG TPA: hypothetical protein [Caudoviricetes sp.]
MVTSFRQQKYCLTKGQSNLIDCKYCRHACICNHKYHSILLMIQ